MTFGNDVSTDPVWPSTLAPPPVPHESNAVKLPAKYRVPCESGSEIWLTPELRPGTIEIPEVAAAGGAVDKRTEDRVRAKAIVAVFLIRAIQVSFLPETAVAERHISPLSLLSPHLGVPAARCGFP